MTRADVSFAFRVVRVLVAFPVALLGMTAMSLSALVLAAALWIAASGEEAKRFIRDVWEIGA